MAGVLGRGRAAVRRLSHSAYGHVLSGVVRKMFFTDLVTRTNNFGTVNWLGHPVWQNLFDLWTMQETIVTVKPELIIESGSFRGGSALFYAHLFDLMGGQGRIISIDVQQRHEVAHPRITFVEGSSVDEAILAKVRAAASGVSGPIMVILDSDHSESHVRKELEAYAPFVTPGSFMLVQDGVIAVLGMFHGDRPGPLPAIKSFVAAHPEFEIDRERVERFPITHHPLGWLRRRPDGAAEQPQVHAASVSA
jgi:cephalosporin hydroxylase